MLVVSSREFREHKSKYFDIADTNEQVIVQRGKNKAYALTPVTSQDKYLTNPITLERLNRSIRQAQDGEVTELTKEKQDEMFKGL